MKLSIKKKLGAKGNRMNLSNYDVLIDDEPINGESLLSMNLSMAAGETPKLTLEYRATEIELNDLSIIPIKIVD